MKLFICKSLKFIIPLTLLILGVNFFGDAAHLFYRNSENKIVSILNSGYFVTNISNYDERKVQEKLIMSMKKSPDILILGSSRSMLIDDSLYPNLNLINSSVSGAALKDVASIYQIYKENKRLPKKIILGIDPWMFNENYNDTRWMSLKKYYGNFNNDKEKFRLSKYLFNQKYFQLLSLSYFQSSLVNFYKKENSKSLPIATKQKNNITNTKLLDGSLVYSNNFRNASKTQIDQNINKFLKGDIYGFKNFKKIDKKNTKILQELINDIKENNISLELFLSPYPPKSYEAITKRHPIILKLEKYIDNYSDSLQIDVIGGYNPQKFGLKDTDFYDGMHCEDKIILNIFSN